MKYAALLRGINVGKSVQVPMKELKLLLEELGYQNVTTYLNSGNALFETEAPAAGLAGAIEGALEKRFGKRIPALVLSAPEIITIAWALPAEWRNDETQQTYVAYLFGKTDGAALIEQLPVRREFMTIFAVDGAIIWNILRTDYNKSHINKIVGHPAYALMTTRNANTARKLAELCLVANP